LIIVIFFIAGILPAVYTFLVAPEYQVASVLRPAAIKELDALNRSEVYTLPSAQELIKVGGALESYDIRLGFFCSHQHLFKDFSHSGRTLEQRFKGFNKNSISLEVSGFKKTDAPSNYIKLEMICPKGLSAARSSCEMGKEAWIAELVEKDVLCRAQLQDELKALHAQLKVVRGYRLALLGESIAMAKSLGIPKLFTLSSLGDKSDSRLSSVIRTEINNQQFPLYFIGGEALEAERKNDDFTDARIAQIAKDLRLLQSNREIELLNNREHEDLFLRSLAPLRGGASGPAS